MGASTRVLHSMISCRILLNLKQAMMSQSTLTEVSTGLAFAHSNIAQQTNQQETIQLERYGAQGGSLEDLDPAAQEA